LNDKKKETDDVDLDNIEWGDDDIVICGIENPEYCESCQ